MPALTGIRGIAALWVFCFHVSLFRGWAVFSEGYLAVDLFFILSGFILSYAHEKTLALTAASTFSFYRNRVARIFPLHLFALALVVLSVVFSPAFSARQAPGFYGWSTLFQNVFLIQTWTDFSAGWNGPSWSLSAEWLAYLFFPVLLFAVRRLTLWQCYLLAAFLLAAQIFFYEITSVEQMAHAGKTGVIRVAVEFTVGMLCYQIHKMKELRLPSLLVFSGLILCLVVENLRPFVPTLFAIIVALCAQKDNLFAKVLSFKPIVFLGDVSFSLYILQWNIIELALAEARPRGISDIYLYPLILLATAGLTLFSYYFIEQPSKAWGKRRAPPPVLSGKTSA